MYKQEYKYQPARTDSNHKQVLEILRRGGWSASSTHRVGFGFPDIVAARAGLTIMVEVKDGAKVPSARKLSKKQVRFLATWPGQVIVAVSGLDALSQCNRILDLDDAGREALIARRKERYRVQVLQMG